MPILAPEDRIEVDALVAAGKPVPAIKRVRELTGLNLADAKRLVDALQA